MIGYGGFNNYDIKENIKETKRALKAKDAQSQGTSAQTDPLTPSRNKSLASPNRYAPQKIMEPYKPRQRGVSSKAHAAISKDNAYSDFDAKEIKAN